MSRKATHDSSFCLRLCLSALCTAQSASRTPTPGRKPVYSCGSCSHDHALILARITDDTMDAKPSCIPIVLHPESCSRFLPGLYTAIPLADVHCLLTLPCLSSCPAAHLDVFLPSHDLQGLAPAIGLSCCSAFSPLVSSASTSGGSCSPGYDPVVHSAAIASVINAFALSRLSKNFQTAIDTPSLPSARSLLCLRACSASSTPVITLDICFRTFLGACGSREIAFGSLRSGPAWCLRTCFCQISADL